MAFRALTLPWKPGFAVAERPVAITLSLDRDPTLSSGGLLSVRACDGHELRGTEQPLRCAWAALPAADGLSAALRPHPLFVERWQLSLQRQSSSAAEAAAPLVVDLTRLRSRDAALAATEAAKEAARQRLEAAEKAAASGEECKALEAEEARADAEAAAGSAGLAGEMLKTLQEQLSTLRAQAASRAAHNAALADRIRAREAELEAEAEQLRASETAELGGMLPLLLSKRRMLDDLEKEVVAQDLHVPKAEILSEGEEEVPVKLEV